MTAPTRVVTVKLFNPDGTPCPDGTRVSANLDGTEVYQGFVVPREVVARTTDGIALLACFPNHPITGLGTQGTTYTFRASWAGSRPMIEQAQVPDVDCTLDAIRISGAPLPAPDDAAIALAGAQAAAAAAGSSATAAAGAETAAAGSVAAAAGHATSASSSAGNASTSAAFALAASDNATTQAGLAIAAAAAVANSSLLSWAYSQAFQLVSATRNSDGAITAATIVWPDGVAGIYTADTLSTDFPGATDAWHATYNGAPFRTVTQTTVTRDAEGAVTAQPDITIT